MGSDNLALLARVSNWLHGRAGESVLELAKAVDGALAEIPSEDPSLPITDGEVVCKVTVWKRKGDRYSLELVNTFHPRAWFTTRCNSISLPDGMTMTGYDFGAIVRDKNGALLRSECEHPALARGCEFCLKAARALTPEERDECMLLLESIEMVRCQVGGIYGCPLPATAIGHNDAGGGSAVCQQHFNEDQARARPIWIKSDPCPQDARLLNQGRILIDRGRRERALAAFANSTVVAPTTAPADQIAARCAAGPWSLTAAAERTRELVARIEELGRSRRLVAAAQLDRVSKTMIAREAGTLEDIAETLKRDFPDAFPKPGSATHG